MKAMILAAGRGTRLKPVTDSKPKALLEIGGRTLLEIQIRKLLKAGIKEIIINVHHFADQIEQYLHEKHAFGASISISDEREELLDTGGGIRKASWFFNNSKTFLVQNVDVITDLDLADFVDAYMAKNADVLLAVRKRTSGRQLLFNKKMQLKGWQNLKENKCLLVEVNSHAEDFEQYAFSGIHLIRSSLAGKFAESPHSIIRTYLQLASEHEIHGYDHTGTRWWDIGKYEELEDLKRDPELLKIIKKNDG
ncbi:MAG: nucleotidyltransferase family protein [Bacteroidota bacterium]|nr:nucleotidyltransferase family protein [Bacteroidota bacterium]